MKKLLVILGLVVLGVGIGAAKKQKATQETVEVVDIVVTDVPDTTSFEIEWPDYAPWTVVNLEGKMKMKGLPLSPTVKIFMKRGQLVNMSLRAPFIGEVGRLDLTPDGITIINKMNKTYVEEEFKKSGLMINEVLSINDLQDLLLGRFFIPGHDVMKEDLDELVEIFYEDDQFNVIPKKKAEIPGVRYGFAVDESFNPTLLVVMPLESSSKDLEVSAEYIRKLSGYDLTFAYAEGSRGYEMTLELKNPVWNGDAPKAIDLGKYRKVSFQEFMRSMR